VRWVVDYYDPTSGGDRKARGTLRKQDPKRASRAGALDERLAEIASGVVNEYAEYFEDAATRG